MLTTIIGFISGTIIPLITKYIGLKNEQKEIEVKTAHELQLQKMISDNELAKEMSITEREIAKASFNSAKNKNYIINILLDSIRIGFGLICIAIMISSIINLWKFQSMILMQEELATAFFIILGYYFGERSAKKVWGK